MITKNIVELVRVIWYDFLSKDGYTGEIETHLDKAIKWLCSAQDSTSDGGVSEGYHLYHGWLPSYPETTGYIIETFFDYYQLILDETLRQRAVLMANWLLSIQNTDGSIPDSYFRKKMVFDTGMVIFGFVRTFNETGNNIYKEAAIKAADWLVRQQENDGSWVKFAADSIPHTYYSRVSWSLLMVHGITSNDDYKLACKRNIEWCLKQQNDKGWFDKASFNTRNHHQPFTHTIAYTLRGILESGIYLNNDTYINAVKKSIDSLLSELTDDGYVCATYSNNWSGDKRYSCLTGNAQLAIILYKLYTITNDNKYYLNACAINKYLRKRQELRLKDQSVHGALAGSYPVWGKYIHYCYPNWATKFFAESLMYELTISKAERDNDKEVHIQA